MNQVRLLAVLLATLGPAHAQDEPPGPSPQHELLAKFAGTWNVRVRAVTGPGEAPTTGTLVERSRVVCNGLWLAVEVDGVYGGKPYQAFSLLGYDPSKRGYTSIWVDSMDPNATRGSGAFDEAGETFTQAFPMPTPNGLADATSVTRFESEARRAERITIDRDGELVTIMELDYERAEEPAVDAAAASRPVGRPGDSKSTEQSPVTSGSTGPAESSEASELSVAPPESHAALAQFVGTWTAEVEMHAEAQDDVAIDGEQTDRLICGGRWVHSHFTGQLAGQPFEGFGLLGFDPATATYHSYWVDASSPYVTHAKGIVTDAGNEFLFDGESRWPDGRVVVNEERTVIKHDKRVMLVTSAHEETGEVAGEMRITYHKQ